jgi:hypothetical protein
MFSLQASNILLWLVVSLCASRPTHGYVSSRVSARTISFPTIRKDAEIQSRGRQLHPIVSIGKEEAPSNTLLTARSSEDDDDSSQDTSLWGRLVSTNPKRTFLFSLLMASCGAALGPFLDSFHSAFGVLQYDDPIKAVLWGSEAFPALTTAWWVPELFGLAGFLIGWLYIVLDDLLKSDREATSPGPVKTLVSVSVFTLQYWISGILFQGQVDRATILNIMSVIASIGFLVFDGTTAGLITSAATALGGPLIEAGLIWSTAHAHFPGGYHYNDPGETGFFPLWIIPVYFLGGPANGNLARSFWNALSKSEKKNQTPCTVCNDTRRVPCPNCDEVGTYRAMGGRSVKCTSCNGRGFVICRNCFDRYNEDPYDIDSIRETMNRMPD